MSESVQDWIMCTRAVQQGLLLLAVASFPTSSGSCCEGVRFRVERSRLERVCNASRGPCSPKKRVTETQSSSPAGGGSEDDEGLQLIIARDGPKPSSMMEMWWDSFVCSSYCRVGLTESSACQPQSIMCSPASDAEARDGLRGELPARWLKKLGQ